MRILLIAILFFYSLSSFSQPANIDSNYLKVFTAIEGMLSQREPSSFKYAVFLTENVALENSLIYSKFDEHIVKLATLVKYWMEFNPLKEYHNSDSINVQKNYALFTFFKDTLKISLTNEGDFMHLPYTYDFSNFFGQKDLGNMFVTKLLSVHKGNCHSLPYLYKILADELGETCWLSFAPNHMYIKNRCYKTGWYNTELTSGEFPIDAWIATSGYVPVDAIRNGIYMDTLSNQQAIAQCVLDLAKGYEFQTKNYYDGFIIKCCNLTLQYHPLNVQAILLKAETFKHLYQKQKADKDSQATNTYKQMEQLYIKLFELGYREMPEKMYLQWLRSVTQQRDKYGNKQLKETLKSKTK